MVFLPYYIMAFNFKSRCVVCKNNYIIVTAGQKYAVCYDCQKKELEQKINDPSMKKLFNIPEDYYKENSFLRNIKINYLRYGKLSDKQIEAFKKTVNKIKSDK